MRRGILFRILWVKWQGLCATAWAPVPSRWSVPDWTEFSDGEEMPIKRPAFDPATLVPPDLPSESKLLAKLPALRAFLTARSYDGGGVRLPGKIWLEGAGSGFALTLIDVDNALRLVCRAATLDDVFALADVMAGAENAPWEIDQFQAERLAKARKKK